MNIRKKITEIKYNIDEDDFYFNFFKRFSELISNFQKLKKKKNVHSLSIFISL